MCVQGQACENYVKETQKLQEQAFKKEEVLTLSVCANLCQLLSLFILFIN